jgi:hypothetical protein
MLLATVADAHRNGIKVVHESCPELNQEDRIFQALGLLGEHLPSVNEETLFRYYKYLSARLSFPFAAYYPEPATLLEEVQHRCTVVELLDPAHYICHAFDGIYCRTRKGTFEVTLPVVVLYVPENNPNFQLVDDYWFWFRNWR